MPAEIPGEVAGDRFERRLADAHPVVEGPGLGRIVEIQGYDAAALTHQRAQRLRHRLERVGAGAKGSLHALPRGGKKVATQRVRRGEGDGMDKAVQPAPALLERLGQRIDLLLVVDIHLQDLRSRLHPPRALLRERHHAAEAGEHDIGALVLGRLSYGKGDAGRSEDAGDQDLLPFEDARHGGPILSDRSGRLYRVSRSWRRVLNSFLSISPRANRCSRVTSALSCRTF